MIISHRNKDKRLSIRIEPNGFSFCVSPFSEKRVLFYQHYTASDKELYALLSKSLAHLNLKLNPFAEIKIVLDCPLATLMPTSLFAPHLSKEILKFNHKIQGNYQYLSLAIGQSGIVQLYALETELYQVLTQHLQQTIVTCTQEVLLRWLIFTEQPKDNCLYAHYSGHNLYLYAFQEEKLIRSNILPINHPNEIIYNLHAQWQSLGWEYNNQALHWIEPTLLESNLKDEIYSTFNNIQEHTSPDPTWKLQGYAPHFDTLLLLQS